MSNTTRNAGKHTDAAQVEANILKAMAKTHGRDSSWLMSALGEAGFPGYDFKWPQGAAFAVSKIVHGMIQRGLIRTHHGDIFRGYVLTAQGLDAARSAAQ